MTAGSQGSGRRRIPSPRPRGLSLLSALGPRGIGAMHRAGQKQRAEALPCRVSETTRHRLMLGDDPQELNVLQQVLMYGPKLTDQLHLRFGTWPHPHTRCRNRTSRRTQPATRALDEKINC